MSPPQSSVRYGRIVFAWIKDHNGHGKLRPAIIITQDEEITDADELAVMAITTTFTDPAPPHCVPLPWHPRGHPLTKLHQRSAAVVNWLSIIQSDDIVGYGGEVPQKTMRAIRDKLDELAG